MKLLGWITCQLLLLLSAMDLVLPEPCAPDTASRSDFGDLDDDYPVTLRPSEVAQVAATLQPSDVSQVDVASTAPPSDSRGTYVEEMGFLWLIVESQLDVEILAQNLKDAADGRVFRVRWVGKVAIEDTFRLSKGVTLRVVGSSPQESEVNAQGGRQHFVLKGGSSLHLEKITLTGGSGKGFIFPKAGGSIYVTEGSLLNVTDCIFSNNSGASGGAVYAVGSRVTFAGQTKFTGNSASQFFGGGKGGAVGGRPKLSGSIDLQELLQGGAKKLTQGISAIQDLAKDALGVGSGAQSTPGSTIFGGVGEVVNSVMRSIYNGDDSMLLLKDSVSFRGNSASAEGGALEWSGGMAMIEGAANFLENFTKGRGGGMHMDAVKLNIAEDAEVLFAKNNASQHGGGIYINEVEFNVLGKLNISSGLAKDSAGAIYLDESDMQVIGMFSCHNNVGSKGGGALHMYESHLKISGLANISASTSQRSGGAIHLISAKIIFGSKSKVHLWNNSAFKNGGALYSFRPDSRFSLLQNRGQFYLEKNQAIIGSGGAMYLTSISVDLEGKSFWIKNKAKRFGGMAFCGYSCVMFMANSNRLKRGNKAGLKDDDVHNSRFVDIQVWQGRETLGVNSGRRSYGNMEHTLPIVLILVQCCLSTVKVANINR